ncbi:hypothetical protein [Streptomyces sp. NPDC097640]|uniref:hypothetical protein n=1 Tax=Streptomyces sp. NPDC097640 TaxID=3157229 RepID=UPI00332638C1
MVYDNSWSFNVWGWGNADHTTVFNVPDQPRPIFTYGNLSGLIGSAKAGIANFTSDGQPTVSFGDQWQQPTTLWDGHLTQVTFDLWTGGSSTGWSIFRAEEWT